MKKENILEMHGVSKTYIVSGATVSVLSDIHLMLEGGETIALVGPSGSGKSTLLAIAAGLEQPDTGFVTLAGRRLSDMSDDERAFARNRDIGFVYQNFQLVPTLTALENVTLPLELLGVSFKKARERSTQLLDQVGLLHRLKHLPGQLSGGEQQRVALARAFVTHPKILLADEPTGSLDSETAAIALDLMLALRRTHETALCIVTHDPEVARAADRSIAMRAGRMMNDQHVF